MPLLQSIDEAPSSPLYSNPLRDSSGGLSNSLLEDKQKHHDGRGSDPFKNPTTYNNLSKLLTPSQPPSYV